MHQSFLKFRWVLLAVSLVFLNTAQAQRSYRSFLEAGNAHLQKGNYEQAIRQFRAAKISDDAQRDPAVLLMLDGKIEEAFNRQIDRLQAERAQERQMRMEAQNAKMKVEAALDKAEEARQKAYDLSLLLLTTKVEYEVKSTGNFTLAMRLTAFAMRCIDPGNPIFLREFMKAYNASNTAPAIIPIPRPWRYKMASFQDFAISGNARAFAMCSFSKPNLTIFRLDANGEVACTDSLDYKPWSISLSHDGNQLAFYTYDPKERGQVFITSKRPSA
ncbi:MAG: hypothetical protein IPM81_20175 [Saprospirales bacterium]|nr:hypothetical protein [Saprospirales bacterium]